MKTLTLPSIRRFAFISAALTATSMAWDAAVASPVRTVSAAAAFTHQTAPTQYVDAGGIRFAYRRFGKHGGLPMVFFQHFAGTMDNWDPKIVDGFAAQRDVILFDNAGVASSGGRVPTNIEGMARDAISFLSALHVTKMDLLGFSMGSLVSQEIAVQRPELVHRMVLVGSSPRGGVGMASLTPEFQAMLAKKREVPDELLLESLFTPSASSQAAGRQFLTRLRARRLGRDPDVNEKVAPAQAAALAAWGAPREDAYTYLAAIKQPVLLIDGNRDVVFYTVNAFNLEQHLSNAQLIIYPDSGHGPQYRYPDRFLRDTNTFFSEVD
ncbi:alpha/beta fold hydrolase [Bradyrhizobium sp. B120]|uniref:alpha/beta fold hydrolase n=1 Tax=Bradyrhizobium sp. B120 TaxID=3410088 RepID=UPI003B985022